MCEEDRSWEETWRRLRRPEITVEIRRVDKKAWDIFKKHHYLTASIHVASQCWLGLIEGQPVAFASFLRFPHATKVWWRNSRLVVLPDYQGVGIGEAFCCAICAMYRAVSGGVSVKLSTPGLVAHRAKSSLWHMSSKPQIRMRRPDQREGVLHSVIGEKRNTASFEFRGSPDLAGARSFGMVK